MKRIRCRILLALLCLISALIGITSTAVAGDRDGVGGYKFTIYGEGGENTSSVSKGIGMVDVGQGMNNAHLRAKPTAEFRSIESSQAVQRIQVWLYWLVQRR